MAWKETSKTDPDQGQGERAQRGPVGFFQIFPREEGGGIWQMADDRLMEVWIMYLDADEWWDGGMANGGWTDGSKESLD